MNADPAAGADRAPALRRPQERVVVTGVGVVSSVGVGVHTFWPNIVAGKSGVSVHELYKGSIYPTWISSHLPDYEAPDFIDRRELRHMARFSVFALDATRQALADAGLPSNLADMDAGVLLGTAVGGLDVTVDAMDVMRAKGGMRVSPTYIVTSPCNMASYHVAETFRVLGYNNTVVTACAAGTQALGEAANVIRRGDAEIMVAGGTEAGLCELSVAAFSVIRAFSRRNEEPERASRPFDIARDGFVAGEGAAIFILERLDLAWRAARPSTARSWATAPPTTPTTASPPTPPPPVPCGPSALPCAAPGSRRSRWTTSTPTRPARPRATSRRPRPSRPCSATAPTRCR